MTVRLGIDRTQTREISNVGRETSLVMDILNTAVLKIRNASLPALAEQGQSHQAPVPIPLTSDRIQECLEAAIQNEGQFPLNAFRIEAAAAIVKKLFTYPPCIDPKDLSSTETKEAQSQDRRMEQWGNETVEATCHNMELARKTPFEPIPLNQQANCCFRYALERVGMVGVGPIVNQRMLQKILQDNFTIVDEPQEGDLVLFSSGGGLVHLGIHHQGKVLSKEGNRGKVAYIRPIEDLVLSYGNKYQYLRKNS